MTTPCNTASRAGALEEELVVAFVLDDPRASLEVESREGWEEEDDDCLGGMSVSLRGFFVDDDEVVRWSALSLSEERRLLFVSLPSPFVCLFDVDDDVADDVVTDGSALASLLLLDLTEYLCSFVFLPWSSRESFRRSSLESFQRSSLESFRTSLGSDSDDDIDDDVSRCCTRLSVAPSARSARSEREDDGPSRDATRLSAGAPELVRDSKGGSDDDALSLSLGALLGSDNALGSDDALSLGGVGRLLSLKSDTGLSPDVVLRLLSLGSDKGLSPDVEVLFVSL
jgi:hypothetical protein